MFVFLIVGEYAAIGVDVEKYEPNEAIRYLSGPLRKKPGPRTMQAFRSYIAVAPSPSPSYPAFAREVNRRLKMPPFNFKNPLETLGGEKVVSLLSIYLHSILFKAICNIQIIYKYREHYLMYYINAIRECFVALFRGTELCIHN